MKNEISVNIDITVVVHVSVLIIKKGDHVESSGKGFLSRQLRGPVIVGERFLHSPNNSTVVW